MRLKTIGLRHKVALASIAIGSGFAVLLVHDVYAHVNGGVLWNPWLDQVLPFLVASRHCDGLILDCPLNEVPASFAFAPTRRGDYYFQIRIQNAMADFSEQPLDIRVSCAFENEAEADAFVFESNSKLSSFWTLCREPSSGSVLDLGHFNVPRNLSLGEKYVGSVRINGRGSADFIRTHAGARLQLRQMNLK
jgi:hypothetical protein